MKVALGFDHAGFPLKEAVLAVVRDAGHEPLDFGTDSTEPVDYPDIARAVCGAIVAGEAERGVIVCGSGAGVTVAANKVVGIRACTIHDHYTAAQAVEHDDVNVLCLGGRVIGPETAADVMRAFLAASFSGVDRHVRRVGKVAEIERDGLAAHQRG
jgi:ribose 5-phosphate isomerase B